MGPSLLTNDKHNSHFYRWHDAIRTLVKLHLVDLHSIRLSNFGKSSGFYDRQIKTLGTIAASQAQTVDLETNIPVGKIPHFDELISFFKEQKTQPNDRTALIHGDYKIDNLVFHKSEPRVIGILEYVCLFHVTLQAAAELAIHQLGNVHSWTSTFRYRKFAESLLLCPACILYFISLARESCVLNFCPNPWPTRPHSMYIMVYGSCGMGPSLRNAMGGFLWGSSQRGHCARDCGETCAQAS